MKAHHLGVSCRAALRHDHVHARGDHGVVGGEDERSEGPAGAFIHVAARQPDGEIDLRFVAGEDARGVDLVVDPRRKDQLQGGREHGRPSRIASATGARKWLRTGAVKVPPVRAFSSALLLVAAPLLAAAPLVAACAHEAPPSPAPPVPAAAAPVLPRATVEDARAFVARVDTDIRRLWVARDRASWVNQNFITDDTEFLAAAGEEATAEYVGKATHEAQRFEGLELPADLARQILLLRLAQTVPAPADAKQRGELATIEAEMTGMYGKGKYCPPRLHGRCLTLDDLSKTLRTSHSYDELLEAWTGWHAISRPIKPKYERYVELGNAGAKEVGFADLGALWRSGYDMPPEAFEADIERLWSEVKPLYDQLHCYVRGRAARGLRQGQGARARPHPRAPARQHVGAGVEQRLRPSSSRTKGSPRSTCRRSSRPRATTPSRW